MPAIVHRRPVTARHQAEDAELRRRLDWLEQHGIRPDMETVIENMQAELGHPSIDRTLARHIRRHAA